MYLLNTNTSAGLSSKKSRYLVDFKPIMRRLSNEKSHDELLYFYPRELRGFIESCVLSTQRVGDEVASRDWSIYKDVKAAMQSWKRAEEEAAWRQGKELTFGSANLVEHSIDFMMAVRLGSEIDSFVLYQMSAIRDAHGDYAVEPSTFEWTPGGALLMDVYYGT